MNTVEKTAVAVTASFHGVPVPDSYIFRLTIADHSTACSWLCCVIIGQTHTDCCYWLAPWYEKKDSILRNKGMIYLPSALAPRNSSKIRLLVFIVVFIITFCFASCITLERNITILQSIVYKTQCHGWSPRKPVKLIRSIDRHWMGQLASSPKYSV